MPLRMAADAAWRAARHHLGMPSPILVGVEPSWRSTAALALARRLAAATGSPLVLVDAYPFTAGSAPARPEYEAYVRSTAEEVVARLAATVSEVPVSTRVVASMDVGRALAEQADDLGAAMIVIGPTRRAIRGHVALGSIAEALIAEAHCPIVAARSDDAVTGSFTTIGVACPVVQDASPVVAAAAAFASQTGAGLRLISVADPAVTRTDVRAGRASAGELAAAQHEIAARHLDAARRQAPDAEELVLDGDPVEALWSAATDLDLLVCGARPRPRFAPHTAGTVSRALVHEASCPVMIVPPGAVDSNARPALRDWAGV